MLTHAANIIEYLETQYWFHIIASYVPATACIAGCNISGSTYGIHVMDLR